MEVSLLLFASRQVKHHQVHLIQLVNIIYSIFNCFSGESQGCGGVVNLTVNAQHELRAPSVAVNPIRDQGELDCQWTAIATPGKVIRFQLSQIDMTPENCNDDYIEVSTANSLAANN